MVRCRLLVATISIQCEGWLYLGSGIHKRRHVRTPHKWPTTPLSPDRDAHNSAGGISANLRTKFILEDRVRKYSIEGPNGRKWTFWASVRATPDLRNYTVADLRLMSTEAGDNPATIDDWQQIGNMVTGSIAGRRKLCYVQTLDSLLDIQFLVDKHSNVFELGVPAKSESSVTSVSPQYELEFVGKLAAIVVFLCFVRLVFFWPSTTVYYYFESTRSISQVNSDGTYTTKAERSVKTNFRLSQPTPFLQ